MYNNEDFNRQYMNFENAPYPEKTSALPRILFFILLFVVAFFVVGTGIAFAVKKGNLGHEYRHAEPSPEQVVNRSLKSSTKLKTSRLGQLRISTAGDTEDDKAILCVSPWLSYPDNDVQLFEEIFQKERLFKSIISSYFSGKSKKQLLSIGEKKIKEELRQQINSQLILGKITAIYFDDYIFF